MLDANTPQGTGPMTLEQGLAAFKAKQALSQAKPEQANEAPVEETQEGELPAHEENAEAVSADESAATGETLPDNRPVILPDGSEITVEEARKGYLRHADFTRKTQEVAREREGLTAEKQVAMKQIGDLYQQLNSFQEQEPDWLAAARNPNVDPKQLQEAQLYWQHKKSVMAKAQSELEAQRLQIDRANKAKAFQVLNSGEFEPAWKDPKALEQGLSKISEYLLERGLPPEILNGVSNHTLIEIAEESRRYRELQKGQPKAALAVKGKPAPMKPGSKSAITPQSEALRSAEEKFRKNPTTDNAFALEKAKQALRR